MRSFGKAEWRAVPPRIVLTNEDVRRLPDARIETQQQACDRVDSLLAAVGLVSGYREAHSPWATAIPGLSRWRPLRARWWLGTTGGARGAPHRDEWMMHTVLDALTGQLVWWSFSHHDEYEHQRLLNAWIERERRRKG
jgi:hypothetical protein